MAAEVTSVTCNHCGAPLQVPDTTRFLTCSYCGTRLEIHRSGNAVYTEVLAAIEERTAAMAEDLDSIKRQNEIERLDREWAMKRDSLMVSGKNGRHAPSIVAGLFGMAVGLVGGVFFMAVAPSPINLFGLIFLLAGFGGGVASIVKATAWEDAEASYRRERDSLMQSQRNRP